MQYGSMTTPSTANTLSVEIFTTCNPGVSIILVLRNIRIRVDTPFFSVEN
jgi:hypothetical protein